MLTTKLLSHSWIQPSLQKRSWYQLFRNLVPKFSENKIGSSQDGEVRVTSKEVHLEDSKSNIVASATKIVPQRCDVRNANRSVDTGIVNDEKTEAEFSKISLNTEPGEESNTGHESTPIDPPRQVKKKARFYERNEIILAENYHLMGYPTPILTNDLIERTIYHETIDKKVFPYQAFLSFGLANFMSYVAHFCKYEAQNKAEIISVGSGDGTLDREIISTYRKHFGEEIKITLVDPNPDYEVDFKTVDDLLKTRPEAVGNCILLIIWPEPMGSNDGYDIDAVRKLQPLAALVLYEPTQVSGSSELTGFLRDKTEETVGPIWHDCVEHGVGLENYAVEKVIRQQVYLEAGREAKIFDIKFTRKPAVRHLCLVLVKFKKLYKK